MRQESQAWGDAPGREGIDHSFPTYGVPKTRPGTECVGGHHCLNTSHTGAQETVPSPQGLLIAFRIWSALPWSSKYSIIGPAPLSPSPWFYCPPCPLHSSLMCLPTSGLCMGCVLCLTFPAPSLPHLLPDFPTPTHPSGPDWASLPWKRRCPGCPG